MSWEDVGYVLASKTRRKVLDKLGTARTPTILAKELSTSISNVSRALHELQSKSLIECLTPKARVGRIFTLTDRGRKVVEEVTRIESLG